MNNSLSKVAQVITRANKSLNHPLVDFIQHPSEFSVRYRSDNFVKTQEQV